MPTPSVITFSISNKILFWFEQTHLQIVSSYLLSSDIPTVFINSACLTVTTQNTINRDL